MGIGYAMLPFLAALAILFSFGFWEKRYGDGLVPGYIIVATILGMLTGVFGGYYLQADYTEPFWGYLILSGAVITVILWIIGYVKRPKL